MWAPAQQVELFAIRLHDYVALLNLLLTEFIKRLGSMGSCILSSLVQNIWDMWHVEGRKYYTEKKKLIWKGSQRSSECCESPQREEMTEHWNEMVGLCRIPVSHH